jgi:DNA-binding transcriptional ArsR family regulator
MQRDVVVVSDPHIIKVGIEDTRLKILALMKFNDLTVAQIAQVLGKDESTVYRHIEKLLQAGYVEVAGERATHHIPERLYRRTAKVFILSPDEMPGKEGEDVMKEWRREQLRSVIGIIGQIGYEVPDPGEVEERLVRLFTEIDTRSLAEFRKASDPALADNFRFWRARMVLLMLMMRDDPSLAKKVAEALKGIN